MLPFSPSRADFATVSWTEWSFMIKYHFFFAKLSLNSNQLLLYLLREQKSEMSGVEWDWGDWDAPITFGLSPASGRRCTRSSFHHGEGEHVHWLTLLLPVFPSTWHHFTWTQREVSVPALQGTRDGVTCVTCSWRHLPRMTLAGCSLGLYLRIR